MYFNDRTMRTQTTFLILNFCEVLHNKLELRSKKGQTCALRSAILIRAVTEVLDSIVGVDAGARAATRTAVAWLDYTKIM